MKKRKGRKPGPASQMPHGLGKNPAYKTYIKEHSQRLRELYAISSGYNMYGPVGQYEFPQEDEEKAVVEELQARISKEGKV